ncbi:hypothetical protein J3458_002968 [Metarhizium acridum]|uniref:Uncharacterized protein n=1 Tax=Metarhizium acridum (strain CQMa 102) TaxID=655827 RepID=E9DZZ5_METAQ|nr:uncharacterized protein MAC_03193 [Metarhizium acridum CQMa 102]EFY90830.1 hypothetical protein MAC_03193 [Metarhizium acridum CQMa 102]KAG8421061.1 hypothetical protein J3458_002968 [Metarhizium acridum]
MGELPLWQNSSHLGTVQTSGTPWSLKCDEAPCGNHDMLSTPMGTERTDNQLYQRRVPMFEWLIDETRSEFKWYESVYSSLSDEVLSQRKEIRSLRKQNADLCAENDNLRLENHRTREILRVVQEHAEKAVKWGTNAKPRANGNKIPDCEFKSKWRQLKFNVRMLSAHILDNNPAVTLQARDFATIMKSFRNSKGNELHDSSSFQEFQEPGTRRRVLEAYLWNFISEVVFDSKSRIDAAKTGRTFKRHRKEYAKLKIGDSSQIAAVYDWLQSGWPIAKPVTPDSVNELLRKDCEKIYQMIHGKDGRERSDSRAESREELRDILSLALELDDMIMTSRAMVTVVWPNEIPELNAGIHTAYCESYMELVEGDREPGENVGLTLSVTPILLKKGNARGTNYESQIVLVKGDVVVANGSSQGSAEPVQTQEGTIQ